MTFWRMSDSKRFLWIMFAPSHRRLRRWQCRDSSYFYERQACPAIAAVYQDQFLVAILAILVLTTTQRCATIRVIIASTFEPYGLTISLIDTLYYFHQGIIARFHLPSCWSIGKLISRGVVSVIALWGHEHRSNNTPG